MSKYKRLISALEELKEFMVNYDEVEFGKVVSEYINEFNYVVNLSDIPEKEFLDMKVTLFGGMGSLNDLVILKNNGHSVIDEDEANETLDNLRRKLQIAWAEEIGSSN